MRNVLVTGGAGYIGSAVVKLLCDAGFSVFVVDNLSKGQRGHVDPRADFEDIDILDYPKLLETMHRARPEAVIHLAAHKSVAESIKNPAKYEENVMGTNHVLKAMVEAKVPKIIFSSTAAVYGIPEESPVTEETPIKPINPYGQSKAACEGLIREYGKSNGLSHVIFRYFNVVGDVGLRYREKDSQNLFPAVLKVLSGEMRELEVFGDDYDTPDGTCVRDYIHVEDIARAHLLALGYSHSDTFNLGTKSGVSVREIIQAFEAQTGKKIPVRFVARREGDPPSLVADASKANQILGWSTKNDLNAMVESSIF